MTGCVPVGTGSIPVWHPNFTKDRRIIMNEDLKKYAPWYIETIREKLGYNVDDDSHDDEVLNYLQSGEKLSKSKHM